VLHAGYAAFREPQAGTWFIQTLCDVIADHAHEMNFENLLREVVQSDRFALACIEVESYPFLIKVDERMVEMQSSTGKKQVPERKIRCFKKLYLNPGLFG
jgi:hypothetical protein